RAQPRRRRAGAHRGRRGPVHRRRAGRAAPSDRRLLDPAGGDRRHRGHGGTTAHPGAPRSHRAAGHHRGSGAHGPRSDLPRRRRERTPRRRPVQPAQSAGGQVCVMARHGVELPPRGRDRRLMRRRSFLAAILAAVLLCLGAPRPASAQLELDITEGVVEPLPIAISEFYGATPDAAVRGREIADVVSADLERSGLFRPIDRRAFIQSPEQMRDLPRFADWRQINAQALVTGEVSPAEAGGDLVVEFRLWDVFAGTQMRGLRFATAPDNWRRVAHKIADAVYERITGETGYFDTRIVYVAESGPATDRVKRLAIMDQDGANHRFLTDGSELVLTPRFHPNAEAVAFMTYSSRVPQVHQLDLATGAETRLGDFERMTFAPRFAPDGRRVAMSLSQDGNSDIYVLDLLTREQRRLTDHPAIDTSPSFSPDGRRLVFNSDRAGTPQLYVMNAN